jgi:hypothetical protein
MPKIQITLSEKQIDILETFRGKMGNTQAEIVRNIVLAWLAEKSFITDSVKKENDDVYKRVTQNSK